MKQSLDLTEDKYNEILNDLYPKPFCSWVRGALFRLDYTYKTRPEDVEDVTQEIFLKFLDPLTGYKKFSRFLATREELWYPVEEVLSRWIRIGTVNKCKDIINTERNRARLLGPDSIKYNENKIKESFGSSFITEPTYEGYDYD